MFELRVMSGLHRGAALPLVGDAWVIGASEEADLVLFDPGIQQHHVEIHRSERWLVRCLDGGVTDDEGNLHQAEVVLAKDAPFAISGVWLCVSTAEAAWPSNEAMDKAEMVLREKLSARSKPDTKLPTSHVSWRLMAGKLRQKLGKRMVAAVVIITMASTAWAISDLRGEAIELTPNVEQPPLSNSEVRQRLMHMMNERMLSDDVQVDVRDDHIVFSGRLPEDQLSVLDRMIVQFEQNSKDTFVYDNRVQRYVADLPFEIRQIVSGRFSQVVLDDGRRVYPGDVVDGFQLVSVADRIVNFRAGNDTYEVNW